MKKKDGNNKQSYIFTRETLGMTLLLFCALIFIALLSHKYVFASLGTAICTFMYGTFGYGCYIVVAALAYLGVYLVFEKKISIKLKTFAVISATVFMFFLLFHSVTTRNYEMTSYGSYLGQCYTNAEAGYAGYTFGGVICAIFVYPVAKFTTFVGAYVIYSIFAVLCAYGSYLVIKKGGLPRFPRRIKKVDDVAVTQPESDESFSEPAPATPQSVVYGNAYGNESVADQNYGDAADYVQPQPVPQYIPQPEPQPVYRQPVTEDKFSDKNLGRKILFENGEFAAESYRRNMIFNESSYFNHPVQSETDYLKSFTDGKSEPSSIAQNRTYTQSYSQDVENSNVGAQTPSYVYGDKPAENFDDDIEELNGYTDEDFSAFEESASTERVEEEYTDSIGGDLPFTEQPSEMMREEEIKEEPYTRRGIADFSDGRTEVARDIRAELNRDTDIAARDFTDEKRAEEPPTEDYGEVIRRAPDASSEAPESPRSSANSFRNLFSSANSNVQGGDITPDVTRLSSRRTPESNANIFDGDNDFTEQSPLAGTRGLRTEPQEEVGNTDRTERTENILRDRRSIIPEDAVVPKEEPFVPPVQPKPEAAPAPGVKAVKEEKPAEEKPKHVWKKYVRPTLDLLDDYPEDSNANLGEIEENKSVIVETLANFRIASHIADVVIGPAITRYDVVIEDKTNIKNAMKYREAIAMALMKENVNAYLNYTKGAISIEIPNSKRAIVGLKSMLKSSQFINAKPNTLTFALGKDVEGKCACPDITKMPHLLVAGTTGSGKSICLSALIVSLLYKYGPDELRFILVDPKQAEFITYENLPHLMINEIIYNDVDKAIKALNWAIKEMERRYALFKEMTLAGTLVKNLNEYNAHLPEGEEKLPKIVIILDEFGDLMLQAKKDIESRIIRLVQKSRACGIHLILATQRPSVDCITGLIKSNLPTRIGFKVNSFDDSRTIFDVGGGEKLLGKGDMYFRSAENPELARIQGCFVDSHEVQAVTDFVKKNNESYFDQSIADFINTVEEEEPSSSSGDDDGGDGETKIDDKYIQALQFCVESNQASVSMLQRRFPIGYVKACKIIDWMENMNYITQSEGSKPRKVLLTLDEFRRIYGEVDE